MSTDIHEPFFTFLFSTHSVWRSHPQVHCQPSLSWQCCWHPWPYKMYAHHSKGAQASGCCSQALGKFLLTFPVCSTFHCMTVSTNRYHQHLTWDHFVLCRIRPHTEIIHLYPGRCPGLRAFGLSARFNRTVRYFLASMISSARFSALLIWSVMFSLPSIL